MDNKQVVKHWLKVAYGSVNEGDLKDHISFLDKQGFDSWEKREILVKHIQTHHDGHDSSFESIEEYVNLKKEGSPFPPIIVREINDTLFVTVDGQHRVKAAEELGEEIIMAYVGKVSNESFESRKEKFKEKYDLEYVQSEVMDRDKAKKFHLELMKFINASYSEEMPWSSLYFNNNPWTFLDWFIQNKYENE